MQPTEFLVRHSDQRTKCIHVSASIERQNYCWRVQPTLSQDYAAHICVIPSVYNQKIPENYDNF